VTDLAKRIDVGRSRGLRGLGQYCLPCYSSSEHDMFVVSPPLLLVVDGYSIHKGTEVFGAGRVEHIVERGILYVGLQYHTPSTRLQDRTLSGGI
jgi:hypothetical protein